MNTVHTLQSALAMSLLHSLWQAALIAVLAASVLALLERRSAAIRHTVGMALLLAMAAAPMATFGWLLAAPAAPALHAVSAGGWSALQAVPVLDVVMVTAVPTPPWLPWLWCAGVVVMLVRLMGGWWMVRTLDRQAFSPLPAQWLQRADLLRRRLGIRRQVAIRLLHGAGLPCSARAWRPIVWLPISMLTQLGPDQIEALIAHELAHIRRLDWIWNGLQCAVEALLFYHPGMWWLSRRIRQERENACDDSAVAVCGDAIVLAEALATLERHRIPRHVLALSATGGALMHRVTRLLSPDQPAHPSARLRWTFPVGVLSVVCSGALLAAQLQPSRPTTPVANVMPAHPAPPAKPLRSSYAANDRTMQFEQSSVLSGDRSYRASINAAGKVVETYRVDGKPRPIDADARAWITRMQIMAANDIPPLPALPPVPPLPPLAPLPPLPPPPPPIAQLTQTAAYRAAVHAAQRDAGVVAMVGSPVLGGALRGRSRLDDDRADLSFAVSGPKGTARVRAQGTLQGSAWDFSTMDLQSN